MSKVTIKWLHKTADFKTLILAGDIGGTNSNIAVVGKSSNKFTIILECIYKTQEVTKFTQIVKKTLEIFNTRFADKKPEKCAVCAAGPVKNNSCNLTNASWSINGEEVNEITEIPTVVINDFTAISYSLPLMDTENPRQISKLFHPDGSFPSPSGNTKAVIGAGTGLGVSLFSEHNGAPRVFPSEGGHSDFAGVNDDTYELQKYLHSKYGIHPSFEKVVSGQGLINVFNYFIDVKKIKAEGIIKEIHEADEKEIPRLLSTNVQNSKECRTILQFFISIYARFASGIAVTTLPRAGLFLAGGMVSKDEALYTENSFFMKTFLKNVMPNIVNVLSSIPVYIIRDYSTSLYGAANAACWLIEENLWTTI